MGRKKTRFFENITYDRIGEPVNMDKCPECAEHPYCFACIDGKKQSPDGTKERSKNS